MIKNGLKQDLFSEKRCGSVESVLNWWTRDLGSSSVMGTSFWPSGRPPSQFGSDFPSWVGKPMLALLHTSYQFFSLWKQTSYKILNKKVFQEKKKEKVFKARSKIIFIYLFIFKLYLLCENCIIVRWYNNKLIHKNFLQKKPYRLQRTVVLL